MCRDTTTILLLTNGITRDMSTFVRQREQVGERCLPVMQS
jgi:hypothetical protein